MNRGDVYEARLDPTEGSEQAGRRPVIIVSRDSLNTVLSTVVVVPVTSLKPGRRAYPSHALLSAGDGGLAVDSLALGEQVRVISKDRLLRRRGALAAASLLAVEEALRVTLLL